MTVFGKTEDGTLEVCKAKPENRGRYGCSHYDHIELSGEELESSFLEKFNEQALMEKYRSTSTITSSDTTIPFNDFDSIQPSVDSTPLTREELIESSDKLAAVIGTSDWQFLKDFQNKWHKRASRGYLNRELGGIDQNLRDYLESDDPTAVKTREFLGPEIELNDFSEIVTGQVSSMTAVKHWSYRSENVSRAVLTALNNDMTKERYIASIMFFGGRCCYCNTPLQKRPPREKQASGEHLTAINSKEQVSGTRFGNMALACVRCNGDRGDKDLVTFVNEYHRIPHSQKALVLGRIKAFRQFALYEEYPPSYSKKIKETINKLNRDIRKTKQENLESGGERMLSRKEASKFRERIKVAIYDLRFG